MNIGADDTSAILRASLAQSSSFIWPLRMWLSGTFASADSSRIVISERVISRLKKQLVRLLWIDAARHRSRAKRRLAHGGSRRDDHHLAGVQTVGQVVEVGEAGGDAVEAGLAVADRLDLVEDAVHDVGQRRVVLAGAAVGDLVDLGLRLVDHVVDLALAGVADLHDLGAGVDQPAQDRLLAHDLGVVAGVGGDRHVGRERVEVRRPADPLQLAAPLQLGGDGHRVGGLAATVEVDDRVVDDLVGGPVEVDAAHRLGDVGDGVLGQQHRPQDALLGGVVLRRHPVARARRRLAGREGGGTVAPVVERARSSGRQTAVHRGR